MYAELYTKSGAYQTRFSIPIHHKIRGVTLLEFIVVLAILSVSFSVIGPNISRFIAQNRVTAQINHLSALLHRARHQAIDNHDTVLLCPSHNWSTCKVQWNLPIIGFIDRNQNLERDKDETLLFSSQAILPTQTLTGPNGFIRFHDSGQISSAATLQICPKNGDATLAKALFVSLQGRVRLSTDSNNDGIDERARNRNLECQ